MKKLLSSLLLLLSFCGYAQTPGISFQAVILNPKNLQLPGYDLQNSPLTNTLIAVEFTITDQNQTPIFKERHNTTTDRFGMINLLIGSGLTIGDQQFSDIIWDGKRKELQVTVDLERNGKLIELSKQLLTYAPQPTNPAITEVIDKLQTQQGSFREELRLIQLTPGPTGPQGEQGPPGAPGTSFDLSAATDIIPAIDNLYSLGSEENRWAGIHVGPGSIYITDITLQTETELTVDQGILKINGANQLQIGQLKFVDNKIESTTSAIDIQIGELTDSAELVLNRNIVVGEDKGLIFQDGSIQTTAPINADWNSESGLSQIFNKPALLQGEIGPQGPAGIDGIDGATGPTGLQGPDGVDGTNGTDGAQGPIGPQGETGPAGTNGVDGATGPQGTQGLTGIDGADGATGPQGPQGPAGIDGTNGTDGADGAQGPAGPQGETGPAGADGTNGSDGATGPQGPQGPAGTDGVDGVTGPTGLQGPAGVDGTNGADGADGVQGPVGSQGETGPAGADGTNGTDGATGPQGPQGPAGTDGTNGTNGIDGADGATGPQGPAGPQGETGPQGPPGPAGIEVSYTTNFSVVSGTEPVGESSVASYLENGALVYLIVNVDLTNVSNFGSGQYTITLPYPSKYDMILASGHIHTVNKDDDYGIHAMLTAGSSIVRLVYTASSGKDEKFTADRPKTLTVNDFFHISGTYIKQ